MDVHNILASPVVSKTVYFTSVLLCYPPILEGTSSPHYLNMFHMFLVQDLVTKLSKNETLWFIF